MTERRQIHQPTGSFLVRCWAEPREVDGQPAVVRVYVRNLRTGEEHYMGDPSELGEFLAHDRSRKLEQGGRSWQGNRSTAG